MFWRSSHLEKPRAKTLVDEDVETEYLEAVGGVFYIHIASTVDWHVETVIMSE